jgi:hypothetical protein
VEPKKDKHLQPYLFKDYNYDRKTLKKKSDDYLKAQIELIDQLEEITNMSEEPPSWATKLIEQVQRLEIASKVKSVKVKEESGVIAETIDLTSDKIMEINDRERDPKKSRGEHEEDSLIDILQVLEDKNLDDDQARSTALKLAKDRLILLKRAKLHSWKTISELEKAKELGESAEDLALISQIKTAHLQESLLKAQIAANKRPHKRQEGRSSFRGQRGSRGRGSSKKE